MFDVDKANVPLVVLDLLLALSIHSTNRNRRLSDVLGAVFCGELANWGWSSWLTAVGIQQLPPEEPRLGSDWELALG